MHPIVLLGPYRVAERIAHGAFGRVLKVIDIETSTPRALKISATPTPTGDAMLLAEFEQLARLHHPSLPQVYEVGRTTEVIDEIAAGAPFFISEWIAGGRCDTRRWDDASAVWCLLADIAGGL